MFYILFAHQKAKKDCKYTISFPKNKIISAIDKAWRPAYL